MTLEGLYTATIGSFPLDDSERNRARILDDLIKLDIDFPNYPQLIEMGKQFLDDIKNGVLPLGLEPLKWTTRYLEMKGLRNQVRLKACLTGPFTLAFYVKKETTAHTGSLYNTMLADKGRVDEYANILSETCKAYGKEAEMIFIDEPMLSLIVGRRILLGYTENDFIHTYNTLRNACGSVFVGTHVCGRISPLLANTLLKTDIDILSHEFYGTPENFTVYTRRDLEAHDKTLAIGCLSAREPMVESIEDIKAIVEQSTEKYGKNLIFTPDDGFGSLVVNGSKETGYKIALRKLQKLKKALYEVNRIK